jgi:hypothetical protein
VGSASLCICQLIRAHRDIAAVHCTYPLPQSALDVRTLPDVSFLGLEHCRVSTLSFALLSNIFTLLKTRWSRRYGYLRNETGVHRVQRVPTTETQGRVHTSTAVVVVLPEPTKQEVNLHGDLLPSLSRFSRLSGVHVTCSSFLQPNT